MKKKWGIGFLIVALALVLCVVALAGGFGAYPAVGQDNSSLTITRNADVSGDCVAVLGLGAGPVFWPDRNNTGFALFHNGKAYLIDCGAGTPNAFYNLGVKFDAVAGLFFTHYHMDHTNGLVDLLSRGWRTDNPASLQALDVYGPDRNGTAGTPGALNTLMTGATAFLAPGVAAHHFGGDGSTPPAITQHAITDTAGVVNILDNADVKVDAVVVDHDEFLGDSYSYKFTLKDGSENPKTIVFSGDRAYYNAKRTPELNAQYNSKFASLAEGATILVHEVQKSAWAYKISPVGTPLWKHLVYSHTDVAQIPALAEELKVGAVVLNHYSSIDATYNQKTAAAIIRSDVLKANAALENPFTGIIIAPQEMDVIHF